MQERQIQIEATRAILGRPPLLRLNVTARATNTYSAPKWLVIPKTVYSQRGTVGKVATVRVLGCGQSHILEFLGSGGFYLVGLPTRGSVDVTGLQVRVWQGEEPVRDVRLSVMVVDDVDLGGVHASSFADIPETSRISMCLSTCESKGTRELQGGSEVKPVFLNPIVFPVTVRIPLPT